MKLKSRSTKQALDFMGLKLFLELYLEASELSEQLSVHLFLSLIKRPGPASTTALGAAATSPQSSLARTPIHEDLTPDAATSASSSTAHYTRAEQHTHLHAKNKQLFGASYLILMCIYV